MPREGAFAANFKPDTLNRFRELCKQQGRQYTKVLERLAEIYLQTNGKILEVSVVPEAASTSDLPIEATYAVELKELMVRMEQMESAFKASGEELERRFTLLSQRLESITKQKRSREK